MATIDKPVKNADSRTLATELPDPAARTDADIVIYDGDCKFCQRQVKSLNWFTKGRLAFISLHDARSATLFPELTHEQMMQRMYVVTPAGQYYGGASGVRYLSTKHTRLWLLAPLLHIPLSMPLWEYLYNVVAKNRYRLAGKNSDDCADGKCDVHFKQ